MGRRLNQRTLRSSTLTFFAMIFLILTASAYILLNTVMIGSINQLEEKNIADNIERAVNAIEQQESSIASITKDWAAWNDTYEFVQDRNQKYLDSNIYEDVFVNLNLDVMAIVGRSGEYIFATGIDRGNFEFIPVTEDLAKALNRAGILYNADPDFVVSGIIKLPEGILQIASHPVLRNDLSGPVMGNMIFGKFLDEKCVQDFSDMLRLEMSIEKTADEYGDQEFDFNNEINTVNGIDVKVKFSGEDRLEARTVLKDINGDETAELEIEMTREVRMTGKKGIESMLYSLVAAGLTFIIILWLFLEKNVISRILNLSRDVVRAGDGNFSNASFSHEKKNDEISTLSEEIRRMLERRKSAEEELKNAKDELEAKIKIQDEMMKLAYHDHLTGLPNKLMLTDRLRQAISLARRTQKYLGVIFIDLDEFKTINDTLGHDQGDELLREVADRISGKMREEDTVCRAGGDEFIILVQNLLDPEDLSKVAEKIKDCFSESYRLKGQDFNIKASVGLARYPSDGEDIDTLIRNADIDMYKAKEKNRQRRLKSDIHG